MKIAASNIMYNSTASFELISHETIYNFDENQMVLEKEETRTKESRHKTAAAYYHHTNGDERIELEYDPGTRISEVKIKEQPGTVQEEGFEKKLYLASVFTWAADTIDKLVSGFEQAKESRASQARAVNEPRNLQASFTENFLAGSTLGEQRVKIYREMASSLRAKAMALVPEAQVSAETRLRRTLAREQENLNVRAQGVIQTMDGREISFSLGVKMERENLSRSTQSLLIDPLVVNFEGDSADLTDEKIYFDLDSDGTMERISTLEKGSGFLALDLNKDGHINNGSELFGPSTGDGFLELAMFDSDGNNWIDENDPVYDDLLIWIRDDSSVDILKKLDKAGIGAIHLGSVDSAFTIKGAESQTLGQIAQTGIALGENGEVKTIQQIDLTV